MSYFFEGKLLIAYIIICIGIITIVLKNTKQYKYIRLICLLVFFTYLYYLIDITQFPIYMSPSMEEELGGNILKFIHLIPITDIFNITSLYNIIAALPMGFLIPLIFRNKFSLKKMTLISICTGIILELGQLCQLLIIGYTLRQIDIDDIICNAIGVIFGYFTFKVLCKTIFSISEKANMTNLFVDYLPK